MHVVQIEKSWAALPWALIGLIIVTGGCASHDSPRASDISVPAGAPTNVTTVAPGGKLSVRFALRDGLRSGMPSYSISYGEKLLIADSPLQLVFQEPGLLTGPFRLVRSTRATRDERYEMVVPSKTRFARDHYNQTTIDLEEREPPHRRLRLVFRAYDDGIAFRFVIPEQPGVSSLVMTDERSSFHFAGDPMAYAMPLPDYATPHEAYYKTLAVSQIPPKALLGLPLLLEFKGGPWVAITEADLTDYAGMYLTPAPATPPGPALISTLAPLPGQSEVKVKRRAPMVSPWRVVMVGNEPGRLIESNLVCNLNPPCAIANPSWIHVGKVAFPWWNGYAVPNQAFKGGMNTATMKYYVDFCAANGIEFHSIDGNDVAWYGGPCEPYQGADITKPIPAIDMPAVLAYAKQKGVRTRLWVNWAGLRKQMDQALDTYQRWGVDGIMVDFLNRNDQEMVNFVHEVAAKTAARHLTVNFHNLYEPTGLQRTYPNVLNFEAVLNLEYNKWSTNGSRGSTPEHDLTVPFTRMLAGPMDFHSGGMRSVRLADFKFQWVAPQVMGTRSHELARYVVYENPMPMLADDPAAYQGQIGLDFLRQVPTTWDETCVLAGRVGEYVVIARRHGDQWYLGAMNGSTPRTLTVPLWFLGARQFDADVYADDMRDGATASAAIRSTRAISERDSLSLEMSIAGGLAVRFTATAGSGLPSAANSRK